MRRLAFLVVGGAVWLLLGAVPASADNGPHMSTAGTITDRCAGCHRLHSGQAPYLLREEEPALCYTCHGTTGTGSALSVQNGVAYSSDSDRTTLAGALRGGGFEYALLGAPGKPGGAAATDAFTTIAVAGSPQPSASSHSLDGSAQTAWGNGAFSSIPNTGVSVSLTCTSCHDPHGGADAGTATYRILKPNPTGTTAAAANCLPTGVNDQSTPAFEGACSPVPAPRGNTVTCYLDATYSPASAPRNPNTTNWRATCFSTVFPEVSNSIRQAGNTTGTTPTLSLTPAAAGTPPTVLVIPKPNVGAIADVGATKTYTTTDYWSNLVDPAKTFTAAAVFSTSTQVVGTSAANLHLQDEANFCSQCHSRYKATSGRTYLYNTGDAVFTYRHRSDSGGSATNASPSCIQCHVAHGSNSQATGIAAAIDNPGGGRAGLSGLTDNRNLRADERGVCQFCHNK